MSATGFAIKETRTHHLMHGYVFKDEQHATEWFAQGFDPRSQGYQLWRVELTEPTCRTCGHYHGPRVKKWIAEVGPLTEGGR